MGERKNRWIRINYSMKLNWIMKKRIGEEVLTTVVFICSFLMLFSMPIMAKYCTEYVFFGVFFIYLVILLGLLLAEPFFSFLEKKKEFQFQTKKITKYIPYKSFLPKEKREEIEGDLYELKEAMQAENYSAFQIWRTLTWQKITIIVSLKYDQLQSWAKQYFKISN